jgi:transcriptional regulator with XRE-family HTH domain
MNKGKKKPIHQLKARITIEAARRGMSMSAFARKISRTPQALNDLLNRNNPRLDTIREFAEAFGMTMNDFVKAVTPTEYGEVMIPRK